MNEEPGHLRPLQSVPTPGALPISDAVPESIAEAWARLPLITVEPSLLERNRVITAKRSDPAYGAFDVLRTKLVQALAERGWRRVGITSPTKGCGKSFLSVNLAATLSRYDGYRTVLLDMDLHIPAVARMLGVPDAGAIGDFLRGLVPPEQFLRRVGPNQLHIGPSLAVGANGKQEPFPAELLHDTGTREALARIDAALDPHVVLFDLPPALAQDDVLALKPHLDCVIMVAGGGMTTARELKEASRRLGEDLPILGIVLNKAEGAEIQEYRY